MRVLIAPDCFTGSLTAAAAAQAIAAGWLRAAPSDTVTLRPLSDGGPGLIAVLAGERHSPAGAGHRIVPVVVPDPCGRPVPAQILLRGGTAWIESAQACGLALLAEDERDPRLTSSAGLGTALLAARKAGAARIVVGLGGSGTNDGGAGMLGVLGAPALDGAGLPLPPGGAALARASGLGGVPNLAGTELIAATDVDSPLLGPAGASAVYGPQKGADAAAVLELDAALAVWAGILRLSLPHCPAGVERLAGAGAAGGIGAALLALGARRESGVALVATAVGLDAAADVADLVVTGEGSFDAQSLRGKVVHGVASCAVERGLPCVVLAGRIRTGRREQAASGVDAAYALTDRAGSERSSMRAAARHLADLAEAVAREWSTGHGR